MLKKFLILALFFSSIYLFGQQTTKLQTNVLTRPFVEDDISKNTEGITQLYTVANTSANEKAPYIAGNSNYLYALYEYKLGTANRTIRIKVSTNSGQTWSTFKELTGQGYNLSLANAIVYNNKLYIVYELEYSTTDIDLYFYSSNAGLSPSNEFGNYIDYTTQNTYRPAITANSYGIYVGYINATTQKFMIKYSNNGGQSFTAIFTSNNNFSYPSTFLRVDADNGGDVFVFNTKISSYDEVIVVQRTGATSWQEVYVSASSSAENKSSPSIGKYGNNWIVAFQGSNNTIKYFWKPSGSSSPTLYTLTNNSILPSVEIASSGFVACTFVKNQKIYKKTSGVAQIPTWSAEEALYVDNIAPSTDDFQILHNSTSNSGVLFASPYSASDYDIYFAPLSSLQPCVLSQANNIPNPVPSSGGNYTMNVTLSGTNCNNWTINSNVSWITVNPTSGGNGTTPVSVNVAQNTSTNQRTGTITITSSGASGSPITITVIQSAAPQPCVLSQANNIPNPVPSSGGNYTMNVTLSGTNCNNWTINSNVSWITVNPTSGGNGTTPVSVNVAQNTSTNQRTGTITITSNGATGSPIIINVTQSAALQSCVLSQTNNIPNPVASGGGNYTVNVTLSGTSCNNWTISSSVSWITLSPTSGGNGTTPVSVTIAQNTSTSQRSGTITITSIGATGSPISISVLQQGNSSGPGWVPVPNQQYNMQIIAQLFYTNVLVTNPSDVIGAFVGSECRGIANPQGTNGLIFLTVGSNSQSGETVSFKYWNSSTNEIFFISQTVPFQNMGEIGTLTNPFRLDAGLQTQIINFGAGYTWFSINVNPGNLSLNSLFVPPRLNPAVNDRVIGQTQFATWSGSSWLGSLTSIDLLRGYIMKLTTAQICTLQGTPVPTTTPISLGVGYTWLAYLPQTPLPVNTALSGLTPQPAVNDRIIGQTQFATWSGSSWLGSLTTMEPGKMYVIKLSNLSTLVYPNATENIVSGGSKLLNPPNWVPVPNLQYNMSIIAKVWLGGTTYSTNPNDILGAFVGTECRGIAYPIQPGGFYFLTIGSNLSSGETITFKYYNFQYDSIVVLNETIQFVNMGEVGTLADPFIFNASSIPVELISFNANRVGNNVELNWVTATETNNFGFDVERLSPVETNWSKIGFVKGFGTTSEFQYYSFTDKNLTLTGDYKYRLKQNDYDGSFKYLNVVSIYIDLKPTEYSLAQNYPNPFNPSTTIEYEIPEDAQVLLKVYDALGNNIAILVNEHQSAGRYNVVFEANYLSNGIYFYELSANDFRQTKKLILMK